jgi:hypothetical protein
MPRESFVSNFATKINKVFELKKFFVVFFLTKLKLLSIYKGKSLF